MATNHNRTVTATCNVCGFTTGDLRLIVNHSCEIQEQGGTCEDFPCCGHEFGDCNGLKYGSDEAIQSDPHLLCDHENGDCEVEPEYDEDEHDGEYVATMNTPGYLPDADQFATFATAREAWAFLAEETKRYEDDFEGGYSAVTNQMESLGNGTLGQIAGLDFDLTGSLVGPTPGYEGDHDLGQDYTVSRSED